MATFCIILVSYLSIVLLLVLQSCMQLFISVREASEAKYSIYLKTCLGIGRYLSCMKREIDSFFLNWRFRKGGRVGYCFGYHLINMYVPYVIAVCGCCVCVCAPVHVFDFDKFKSSLRDRYWVCLLSFFRLNCILHTCLVQKRAF